MRELSVERELAAEKTIQLIPEVLQYAENQDVFIMSEIKLRELEKTAELVMKQARKYTYKLTDTSVIKSESICRIQPSDGLAVPVTVMYSDLYDACRAYNNAIVISDINAIVPGGGFRVGDNSNEAQICRHSTLYQCLNTKIAKMRFYYSNATTGRWAQDSVVVVPEVMFFSKDSITPNARHVVLGIAPPNMSVTSTQLKLSARTNELFTRRVQNAFDLALCMSGAACSGRTLIVPVMGYKTFNLPAKLCVSVLVDAIDRISTSSIREVVLVIDDETSVLGEAIISRLRNFTVR